MVILSYQCTTGLCINMIQLPMNKVTQMKSWVSYVYLAWYGSWFCTLTVSFAKKDVQRNGKTETAKLVSIQVMICQSENLIDAKFKINRSLIFNDIFYTCTNKMHFFWF